MLLVDALQLLLRDGEGGIEPGAENVPLTVSVVFGLVRMC